jgi:hypothetical protein
MHFQGSLNATGSVDPDFDNLDGINFVWYCKDVADADFNMANLTHEPLVSEHDVVETQSANSVRLYNFVYHGNPCIVS